MTTPNYLKEFEDLYKNNPREANKQWFKQADYGLFIHYGLYSIVGRHEWVQLRDPIRVDEYAKLVDQFTAQNFDPEYIVKFAKDCGMKYVNITTRHHDSFCLWDTKETEFNSVNSPAGRDFIAEFAEACEKHEIGLFLYYSHGRDWKHPHAPNNAEWGGSARPLYDPIEESYKYGDEQDLNKYLDFMSRQITELLTNYPTAAGIWLDGLAVPVSGDHSKFKCQDLYDMIHRISPHALVSYKQGLLGTEDYFSPEHYIPNKGDTKGEDYQKNSSRVGKIDDHKDRKIEICTTMIQNPISWGYQPIADHRSEDDVVELVSTANENGANVLINTGPMADGMIDPIDDKILRAVGKRLVEFRKS